MRCLAIMGASGHGKVVADVALRLGWQEIVFFDDEWPTKKQNGHWKVLGNGKDLISRLGRFDGVIVGIGNNEIRWEKFNELRSHSANLVSLIDPNAVVSQFATVGTGSVVFAGAIVQVDSILGEACIINTGSTVDHDCVLDDSVHISPGANLAGGVHVGPRSWVGIGANVKQLVQIGADVMVGAGAAVIRNVPDGQTVVGVPARAL